MTIININQLTNIIYAGQKTSNSRNGKSTDYILGNLFKNSLIFFKSLAKKFEICPSLSAEPGTGNPNRTTASQAVGGRPYPWKESSLWLER
jgi:hypothetical protein